MSPRKIVPGEKLNKKMFPIRHAGKVRDKRDKGRSTFDRLNKGQLESKVDASQLTPLTKSCTNILSLNKNVLRPPPPLQAAPHKRDKSKWYDFHGDHGHRTEECKDLMSEIEDYIKHGLLQQYVARPRPNPKARKKDRSQKTNRNQDRWKGQGYQGRRW